MILKILGFLDIVCVFILFAGLSSEITAYAGIYLIIKGLLFAMLGDWMSWFDVLIGLYLILMCFGISFGIISFICILYLLQKSLFSFLGG